MSELIRMIEGASLWILVPGALGGGLNALISHSLHLRPAIVRVGSRAVLRLGFIGNVAIGTVAGALITALADASCAINGQSPWVTLPRLSLAIIGGVVASRLLTLESDKKLLHSALCKASAAPAAHPDTVREIETGSPYAGYLISGNLMPKHAQFRSPGENAQ